MTITTPSYKQPIHAKWWEFLGNRKFEHRADFIYYAAQKYGDVVKLPKMFGDYYLFNTTSSIHHILFKNAQNYTKHEPFYERLSNLLGRGLLTNEDQSWVLQRQQLQPYFHSQNIQKICQSIATITQQFIKSWDNASQSIINIDLEMLKLMTVIAGQTLFNKDYLSEANNIVTWITTCNRYISKSPIMFPIWFPSYSNLHYHLSYRALRKLIITLVNQRLANPNEYQDLLTYILNCKDANNHLIDKELMIDETLTFLITGHETLGSCLGWMWYCLTKNPTCYQKFTREITQVLNGRLPTVEDLDSLPYCKMIIQETMRLYPPVWGITRKATHDDQIDGYFIPKESLVMVNPYVMHRHPDYWQQPDNFIPERFSAENIRAKCSYFPFSLGPRTCIATNLAMQQALLIIATIGQQYEFELITKHKVKAEALVIFKAANKIKMKVKKIIS